jgi:hypothetical protein
VSSRKAESGAPGKRPATPRRRASGPSVTPARARELGRVRCGPLYLRADLLLQAATLAVRDGVSRNEVINAALEAYMRSRENAT